MYNFFSLSVWIGLEMNAMVFNSKKQVLNPIHFLEEFYQQSSGIRFSNNLASEGIKYTEMGYLSQLATHPLSFLVFLAKRPFKAFVNL